MGFGVNNPIPQSLNSECKKVAKILTSFVKPNQVIRYEEVIPPHVLQNAQGLCVMTVIRAGFLFSGRAGSGLIVSRLSDGTWSPPSAVMTAGAGAGGMIGADLTDFIFILNTKEAVNTFASAGTITLGGNVSVAAGPLGRAGEASAAAGTSGAATVFSYSKTKGLYAGISLEGSVIVERKDANQKFYGSPIRAKQILSGRIPAPPGCEPLFRVLDSRAFRDDVGFEDMEDDFYDDLPSVDAYDDAGSMRSYRRDTGRDSGRDSGRGRYGDSHRRTGSRYSDDYDDRRDDRRADPRDSRRRDYYEEDYATGRANRDRGGGSGSGYRSGASNGRGYTDDYDDYKYRNKKDDDYYEPPRDEKRYTNDSYDRGYRRSPSPVCKAPARSQGNGMQALALFAFNGEEKGDLSFRKGDVINITSKSDSTDDWWTGEVNGATGIFPANYVELL